MKELILIEGLSKDELFTAIQAVVKDLLFFEKVFENETITSLKVMESDRANQFAVRPNRLCGGWDFYSLCGLFKSELSVRKDVVIKAWFQLPDDETMSVLPKGKYYYDLSDGSTDEIVASTGTRYCPCEKVDEESGAELMDLKPQGTSTYEPRPKLQLRPAPDGCFEVEKLTVWQKIKKRHAGFMDSHTAFGVGLWSIIFIVLFFALVFLSINGGWDFSETVLPFTLPWWGWMAVCGVVGLIASRTKLLRNIFDGWRGPILAGLFGVGITIGLLLTAVFSVNVWLGSNEREVGRGVVLEHNLAGRRHDVNQYSVRVEEPVRGYIYIATGDDGSFGPGDTVAVPMIKGLFGMYHAETLKPLD